MAGRAPKAYAAPHRTRRSGRQGRDRRTNRRRPRHDLWRAALDGRQAQKRSARTCAGTVERKGKTGFRSGPAMIFLTSALRRTSKTRRRNQIVYVIIGPNAKPGRAAWLSPHRGKPEAAG